MDIDLKTYMDEKFNEIKQTLEKLSTNLEANYVRKEEFQPVKQLVYGLVGLILTSVIGALLALVVIPK